ncbi:hypothetical protein MHTCC0001_21800 [Flavobacteriaceae bacterium MHTCC 0001]
MYNISNFKNCKTPKVSNTCDVTQIIDTIKNGNDKLPLIQAARAYDKSSKEYEVIKTELLPTFRFNFHFSDYALNANITASTGLIYLDVDNVMDIPDNGFIYAKWKSLSTTGYGILVKTYNVTQDNFKDTYDHLGELLDINLDDNARKATQQTILSYDPNLYFNPNSITYSAVTVTNKTIVTNDNFNDIKKVPSTYILKKEKEGMGVNGTIYEHTSNTIDTTYNSKLRFNNISDYFIDNDDDYQVFEDKIKICDPYIPRITNEGKRNDRMYYVLTQSKLLNPHLEYKSLKGLANTINKRMFPRLPDNEIYSIINSVLKGFENGTLEMYYNRERRFLFNPKIKLSHREKMNIINPYNGKLKSEKTKQRIYGTIENWDFSLSGKITQIKIAELSGMSKRTVKRYWNEFKKYVKELNETNKKVSKIS